MIVFAVLCRCDSILSFENAHEVIIIIPAPFSNIGQQKGSRGQKVFCTVHSAFFQIMNKVYTKCLQIDLIKIRFADIQFLTAHITTPAELRVYKDISAEFE